MSAQSLQTEGKLLKETMKKICPPDTAAMEQCQQRWDSIAKPLHSLGRLEEVLIQMCIRDRYYEDGVDHCR